MDHTKIYIGMPLEKIRFSKFATRIYFTTDLAKDN